MAYVTAPLPNSRLDRGIEDAIPGVIVTKIQTYTFYVLTVPWSLFKLSSVLRIRDPVPF